MLSNVVNRLPVLLIIFFFRASGVAAPVDSFPEISSDEFNPWTPMTGGCGGVFFQAEEGILKIEFEKEDLSSSGVTNVRLVVFTPDREVIFDQWTSGTEASDAESADRRRFSISTEVDDAGVYGMMITAAYDRYGEKFKWRFRTNCDKYMIETSRGHKDEKHKEPIVFRDPEKKANLCFLPVRDDFVIRASKLDDREESIYLKDAEGRLIAEIPVADNSISYTVKQKDRKNAPWQLEFSQAKGIVEIEGVTEWGDFHSDYFVTYPGGAYWTPHAESWFPVQSHRWQLLPYHSIRYGDPGERQSAAFTVHNNGTKSKEISMSLEFPGDFLEVKLSEEKVRLAPGEEKEVRLDWKMPDRDQKIYLRAESDDFSTFSSLTVRRGRPAVDSDVSLPVSLQPFKQEHELYGYLPDYPLDNQVYFNMDNKPFILQSSGITSLQDGRWNTVEIPSSKGSALAFDADGSIYAIGENEDREPVLFYSNDGGRSFQNVLLPESKTGSSYDIEQFTGHNLIEGPPPVMRYTRKVSDEKHFWRRYGDLELLIPRKTKDGIEWEDPVLVSEECLGVSSHSGIPSSVVSAGSKIFMCWGEASDPEVSREEIPGVPVYVTEYNRETRKLEKPVLVGFGAPPNDVHNIPGITMDGDGYLHVLTGTHGQPFQYAKSLVPNKVDGGWTEAEPVMKAEDARSTQTYIGLAAGPDNTLYLAFRLWRYDTDRFPDNYYATLAFMSKKPGQPWSEPKILVEAPFSGYSIYRHRLTIDRKGRLFLSYLYWSTYWFYRNDRMDIERSLMMSSDGGETWKLVSGKDFED